MSLKKAEYRGYKVKRSGMENIWNLEKPNGVKIFLRETDEQKFKDEQDFRDYIDLIEDQYESKEECEEEFEKLANPGVFDPDFLAKKLQRYK